MNVTSIIRLLPDSQEQAELFAQKLIEEIKAGHLGVMELKTQFKHFCTVVEILDKERESWEK